VPSCSSLTNWNLSTIEDIKCSKIRVKVGSYPAFLYGCNFWDSYNHDNVHQGLLDNPLPLLVFFSRLLMLCVPANFDRFINIYLCVLLPPKKKNLSV
jgi:hypothetical protein